MLFLALIALAVQSFVVQTHIHASKPAGLWMQADAGVATSPNLEGLNLPPGPDKFPISDDPANCPLCQVVTLSGHTLTAAILLIITPAHSGNAFTIEHALPVVARTGSYSWLGRAPPLV